jgi:hypothetical protein
MAEGPPKLEPFVDVLEAVPHFDNLTGNIATIILDLSDLNAQSVRIGDYLISHKIIANVNVGWKFYPMPSEQIFAISDAETSALVLSESDMQTVSKIRLEPNTHVSCYFTDRFAYLNIFRISPDGVNNRVHVYSYPLTTEIDAADYFLPQTNAVFSGVDYFGTAYYVADNLLILANEHGQSSRRAPDERIRVVRLTDKAYIICDNPNDDNDSQSSLYIYDLATGKRESHTQLVGFPYIDRILDNGVIVSGTDNLLFYHAGGQLLADVEIPAGFDMERQFLGNRCLVKLASEEASYLLEISVEFLPEAQLGRASRLLQKSMVEARWRPGGPGAIQAKADFEKNLRILSGK